MQIKLQLHHYAIKIRLQNTPRMLILNPSRTHNTLEQHHGFQNHFLKLSYTQLQYSKKEIEYTWVLQSTNTIE